jgi:hypothetical protein
MPWQRPWQLAPPLLKRPSSVSTSSLANLTDLGYEEVFTSGTYFRNRYVALGASHRIYGINTDLVKQSQITASAPADTVLQNSALARKKKVSTPISIESKDPKSPSIKSQ